MPQGRNRLIGYMLNRPQGIVIAVRTRKGDDAEFHTSLDLQELCLV
jgi:hypothetical protein